MKVTSPCNHLIKLAFSPNLVFASVHYLKNQKRGAEIFRSFSQDKTSSGNLRHYPGIINNFWFFSATYEGENLSSRKVY